MVNTKAMMGVPVETRAGTAVGKVASFDLDEATGRLTALRVKSRGLASMMADELIVPWDAILELRRDKVIISDAWNPAGTRAVAANPVASAPSLMKEG